MLTAGEIALAASYCEATVWQRYQSRSLPFISIGGRLASLEGDWQVVLGCRAEGPAILRAAFPGVERLSLPQVAPLLRVCTRTLQRHRKAGQIPFYRDDGRLWIGRAELIDWILAHRSPARWEVSA